MHNYYRLSKMNMCIDMHYYNYINDFWSFLLSNRDSFTAIPTPLSQSPVKSSIPAPPPLNSTTQPHPSKNFKFSYEINKISN